MITYGLVQTVGPYSHPGPQRYRQNNIWEERPYWAPTQLGPPNDYELRQVTDQNGYQNLENQVVQRLIAKQQEDMAKFNQSFGSYNVMLFPNGLAPASFANPPTSTPDTQPDNGTQTDREMPDLMDTETDDDATDMELVPYSSNRIWDIVRRIPVTDMVRDGVTTFWNYAAPTSIRMIQDYVSNNRAAIGTELGLRLLLGPNADALVYGLRGMEDAQTKLMRYLMDMAAHPTVNWGRDKIINQITGTPTDYGEPTRTVPTITQVDGFLNHVARRLESAGVYPSQIGNNMATLLSIFMNGAGIVGQQQTEVLRRISTGPFGGHNLRINSQRRREVVNSYAELARQFMRLLPHTRGLAGGYPTLS